jgi:hypothetical protein
MAEPESRLGVWVDPRASVVPLALAALLYLPLLRADYDDVSRLAGTLYEEQRLMNAVGLSTVAGILQVGTSTYFKPQADRMMLAVRPLKAPIDEEQVQRTARVLGRLPDPQTIALHISALALAGRVDEALRHTERLRAFATTQERYEIAEQQVLRTIATEGPRADPLRARLAALR